MNYERLLRRLRTNIFDYTGEQESKADRLLLKIKNKVIKARKIERIVGPYSGLTKKELNITGTCETDWY